jgi:hypothetical protein
MPRQLDPTFAAALESGFFMPFFALEITFISKTFYLWSGPYPLTFNGQTWQGTADLGTVSSVTEKTSVEAVGSTVTLSGVDQSILEESLDDVQLGAPAIIYFGAIDPSTGQALGSPCTLFSGLVDKPTVVYGPDTKCSISVNLESWLIRLSAGSMRRYTSADQRLRFPTDTLFGWVETLNDLSLKFGSA